MQSAAKIVRENDFSKEVKKRFIRPKDGAEFYSMSRPKLIKVAMEAGAYYKIGEVVLINMEILDSYLETYRVEPVFR